MVRITATEAKRHFGKLLNRVAQGEEIVITRHTKPVAKLVPERCPNSQGVREAVAGLRALRARLARKRAGQPKLTFAQFRSLAKEGRR
jgi:prevent-host-death family protein